MDYNIIELKTYDDADAYGYPVDMYFKGISVLENGRIDIDMTENPESAYRFNDLINTGKDAKTNIYNFLKNNFGCMKPKIKKLTIKVE